MNYVIIGNSAGAIGCVEGIRKADKEGKITLIASEPHHTYSRPLISYLLLGRTDEERMKYRAPSFYEDNNVDTKLGVTVTKIDKDDKIVETDGGEKIPYDKLLIATGSNPFIPPMGGLDSVEKKFTFMTLDSAHALDAALTPDSRVLIVGAGLIGLKCAEGIAERVREITVVDLADRILPSILDSDGSAVMQRHIEKSGVRFILSDSVKEFSGNTAALNSGKTVDFDVLVIAVGVRPATALAAEAGIEVNRGIVTDAHCETSVKDIYAAGDCTESLDITTGQNKIMALLPNAYMQGECAGQNMAGVEALYDKAIPMNAIGFFGLHIVSAGSYDGEEYVETDGENYKKLVTKDGLLKGFIIMGDVRRAGIYTSLIREKTPLETIDFELIKRHPKLMAFAADSERRQKLSR
ncbi:MAG: NAD(P)/FAD-dependent oxidoreductase [Oscillospiraceae bacterium]|nr:NAD(P)/FAD-dependent oxidoreductase [Oscillospiraceae bacterium]